MPREVVSTKARFALILPYVGIGVLLILAALGNSAVMAVSTFGIGASLWVTRESPLRVRLLGVVIGALGGSLVAETVHTVYHMFGGVTASGDSGFFYVSAALVGSINAIVMLVVMTIAHSLAPLSRAQ